MNMREAFINKIYQEVSVEGVDMLISTLQSPPGRNPKKELKKLSDYFNSRPDNEKEILKEIIKMSINSAIFDILSILDQVNNIDDRIDEIKLLISSKGKEILLNDKNEQDLHDLFNIEIDNVR